MSLSATLFGRNSLIFKVGNVLGLGIPGLLDKKFGIRDPEDPIADTNFQTSTYGAPLPRLHGTVATPGNVFWLENNQLKAVTKKKKQGGKGGGGQTVKTIEYFATFAVTLCDTSKTGPIAGVRRIWLGSVLYYNAGSNSLETIVASNNNAAGFRIYSGTSDQTPDPRMQADIGVDDCPAYRNTAYIVFYDLALEKYGNSLQAAQVKVEVLMEAGLAGTCTPFTNWSHPLTGYQVNLDRASIHLRDGIIYNYEADGLVHKYRLDGTPTGSESVPVPSGYTSRGRCVNNAFVDLISSDITSNIYIYSSDGDFAMVGPLLDPSGAPARAGSGGAGALLIDLLDGRFCVGCETNATGDGCILIYDGAVKTIDLLIAGAYIDHLSTGCLSGGEIYIWHYGHNLKKYSANDLSLLNEWALGTPNHATQGAPSMAVADGVAYLQVESFGAAKTYLLGDAGAYTILCTPDNAGYACLTDSLVIGYTDPCKLYQPSRLANQLAPLGGLVASEIQIAGIDAADVDVSLLTDSVRGFRIAGGSIRSAIAPLQGAFAFDLIPSGYQIKCIPRGLSPVATIPIAELGAVAGIEMASIVLDGPVREMDTQLPRKVTLKYLDPDRDYDVNEQSWSRDATDSADIQTEELPLVLFPDEARGMAQVLCYLRWLERDDYSFSIPPIYCAFEAADVVDVLTEFGIISLRLPEISYGSNNVISCKGKPSAPALYIPNAVGGQGVVSDGEIVLSGASTLILIDGPLLRNVDDEAGFVSAMGSEQESWPGGSAYRSDDAGQTWDDIQTFTSPGTFGATRTAIGIDDGAVVDTASTLEIDWIAGEPESISDTQFANGYNYFAYGADQRWEIIQARDIELQVDGSFLASHFLRGLRGTEWATGLHEVGDYFVLLEDADNAFIGADISQLNIVRDWRGVTFGKSIEETQNISFAYKGINLKPLSPVNIVGNLAGQDWSISWTRRSRLLGSLWSTGIDLPLGEEAEEYEVDVLNGSDVVRTLTATTSSVVYTGAQQIADFGAPQDLIFLAIYQLSAIVGRGRGALASLHGVRAHRYWRINITATNGSASFVLLQELTLASSVGGTNLATNGASASASAVSAGAASAAIDGNSATAWQTAWSSPQWWKYDFGSAIAIAELRILSAGVGFTDRNPGAFTIQYSDDNSAWATAKAFTFSSWAAGSWSAFQL